MSIYNILLILKRFILILLIYTIVMSNYYDDFRYNLKYYRDKANLSQSELAIQVDCSNGLIGNIEAGKVKPSFDTIIKISEALSITPADLFIRDCSKSRITTKEDIKNLITKSINQILDDIIHE